MIRPEDIRELLRRQPFRQFRIHMSNGETYEVNHPELALVTRSIVVLTKPVPGSEEPIGEGVNLISVLHINNVELMPVTTSTKNN